MPVEAIFVLFLLPLLIGVMANVLFRAIRTAFFVAAIGAPIVVFLCLRALDRDGTWSWLAALLVSPLVMATALVTVLLWFGRSRVRNRRSTRRAGLGR